MNPLPGVPDRLVGAGDAAHQARDVHHNKSIGVPGTCKSNTLVAFVYEVDHELIVVGLIASHAAASWQCRSACLGVRSAMS